MRKLVELTFVSLDGDISAPHEWGSPFWDDEHNQRARDLLFDADALLLGRETYEGFAEAWSSRPSDEFVDRINSLPKYVASTTLQDATWNATIIKGDVAEEVARLKQQPGQNILKFGTGVLDRTLMQHNLVDEFHFWFYPVVAGGGQHLFAGLDAAQLKLLDATPFRSGIVSLVYGPK